MQRLPQAQRDDAERVVASSHGGPADPPLARLLLATGASTAIGAPLRGDRRRPRDDVERRAPERRTRRVRRDARARRRADRPLRDHDRPAARPSAHGAAPRTFFLVTESRTIAVTLPEDAWMHPGTAYDIPLVDPLRASCLSLVLDKAYERPRAAHPEVTIAELTAYSRVRRAGGDARAGREGARAEGGRAARRRRGCSQRAGDAGLAAAAGGVRIARRAGASARDRRGDRRRDVRGERAAPARGDGGP